MVAAVADEAAAREKLGRLHRRLAGLGGAVVAFSGGADSALLAFMARQALGDAATAVTADSPSLARTELDAARDFARWCGIRHLIVPTDELDDERYARNAGDRCYFCKVTLLDVMATVRGADDRGELLLGVNVDDLDDHRPGQEAARGRGALFPLAEAGLRKNEVRWLSKELGLATWDKPAAACLSSRIAYGVPVTREALRRVEGAEAALAELGLSGQVRVRDQGRDLARVEVRPEQFSAVLRHREEIVARLKASGFLYVTLDLEGYRMGSHNAAVRGLPVLPAAQQ